MIISIVIGFIVGCILFYLFMYNEIYRGPNSKDVVNKIYYVDGKMYKLKPVIYLCSGPAQV